MPNYRAAPHHHRNAVQHRGGGLRYCRSQLETYKVLNGTLTTENIQLTAEIARLLAVEPEPLPESQKELDAFWDANWMQLCVAIEISAHGNEDANGQYQSTNAQLELAMECMNLSADEHASHVAQCRKECEHGVLLDLDDDASVFYYVVDKDRTERKLHAALSAPQQIGIDFDSQLIEIAVFFDEMFSSTAQRAHVELSQWGPFADWKDFCKMIEYAPVSHSSRYSEKAKSLSAKCTEYTTSTTPGSVSTPRACALRNPCAPKPDVVVKCGRWEAPSFGVYEDLDSGSKAEVDALDAMFQAKELFLNKCDVLSFGAQTMPFQVVPSKSDPSELMILQGIRDTTRQFVTGCSEMEYSAFICSKFTLN